MRRREDEAVAVDHLHVPVAHGAAAVHRRQDRLTRGVNLRGVLEHETELAASGRDIASADARIGLAQRGANRFVEHVEPLLGDLCRIGFEQQAAAAGKVEAEVDLRIGQRGRPGAAALVTTSEGSAAKAAISVSDHSQMRRQRGNSSMFRVPSCVIV